MNVLLINYEYPPVGGGAANATLFLARAFRDLGHVPVVLTTAYANFSGHTYEDGIHVWRLPSRRRRVDSSNMIEMASFAASALRRETGIARQYSIDGAIAFFTLPCGPVACSLNRTLGIPYVVSLRGGDVPGHLTSLAWMHWITKPLRRSVLRQSLAIVANSAGLAATSQAADPFPVQVIPNGVDCRLFSPRKQPAPSSGPFRILFVGRVHKEKNLALALHQIASLPEAIRDRLELSVAGDGPQRLELQELARALGLSAHISWLGWQEKDLLPELYRHADVLINPSLYEGMSNTVLEAMASGLPVVASDVPGNQAVVISGETGVLFPLRDPNAFGSALTRLATDSPWRLELGARGRKRAESKFSWTAAAQGYVDLLHATKPAPTSND